MDFDLENSIMHDLVFWGNSREELLDSLMSLAVKLATSFTKSRSANSQQILSR